MSGIVAATTTAMPNAPTSVTATENNSSKVTVTWSENVGPRGLPTLGYQIYRGTSPNNLIQVASRSTTTYIDTTVSPQVTYYYAVVAQDSGNDLSVMSSNAPIAVQ